MRLRKMAGPITGENGAGPRIAQFSLKFIFPPFERVLPPFVAEKHLRRFFRSAISTPIPHSVLPTPYSLFPIH